MPRGLRSGQPRFRAASARDLDRIRAPLPDDYVVKDHRHTGLGRLENAAHYVTSVAALFEQVSERTFEPSYLVAAEKARAARDGPCVRHTRRWRGVRAGLRRARAEGRYPGKPGHAASY